MAIRSFKKSIFYNIGIFVAYTFVNTLFLFNRAGGADILFLFLMSTCMLIHLFSAMVKDFKSKVIYRSVIVILLGTIFFAFSASYLKFVENYIIILKK